MIVIKPAAEEHMPQILKIEQDAISPPWTHGALLNEIYETDSHFFVALDDPTPPSHSVAGFSILRRVGDDGELLQIAVAKTARRSGIGDLLMKKTLDHARENRYKSVFLEVRRGNGAAMSLYRKHGFAALRTRRDYYCDPVEDAFVMVKEIHSERK